MRIVQLMHPGREPLLPKWHGERFPVNCGSHWRRYLLARGEFVKPDHALSAGQPEQHEALLGVPAVPVGPKDEAVRPRSSGPECRMC